MVGVIDPQQLGLRGGGGLQWSRPAGPAASCSSITAMIPLSAGLHPCPQALTLTGLPEFVGKGRGLENCGMVLMVLLVLCCPEKTESVQSYATFPGNSPVSQES